ncbi:MAG TPA: helix-turn-helix domain-containing protein [Gaiellaceae bacterium]|nr:helix-turn-helix domain-containing protein [Gaiellaceae bacterium]
MGAPSPLRVERHESPLGAWELHSRRPHPRLEGDVRGYTGYVERGPRPLRRREVPFGGVVVVVSFGPEIRLLDAGDPGALPERRTSFVAGLDDGPTFTEHDGVQHGVQVNLTPLGASRLLGVPMRELARRVVSLEDVLGADAARLAERLHDAGSWEARLDLVDAELAARLERRLPASPDVAWAWRRLSETGGTVSIGTLTEELGCSRRHLTTRFREQVGMPPKLVARVLRFDRAVRALRRDPAARLAGLASACGYYDQAHLNRDFRRFAGTTPAAFAADLLPDAGGVAG